MLTCDDVVVTMTSDGLRVSFVDGGAEAVSRLFPGRRARQRDGVVARPRRIRRELHSNRCPRDAVLRRWAGYVLDRRGRTRDPVQRRGKRGARRRGSQRRDVSHVIRRRVLPGVPGEPGVQRVDLLHRGGRMRRSRADVQLQPMQSQVPGPRRAVPWTCAGEEGPGGHVHGPGASPRRRLKFSSPTRLQQIRNETGETCAVCQIEDAANYKGDPAHRRDRPSRGLGRSLLREVRGGRQVQQLRVLRVRIPAAAASTTTTKHRECWLKFLAEDMWTQFPVPAWNRGEGVPWTSGIVNRTRCAERVLPPPSPPAIVTIPLPQPPPAVARATPRGSRAADDVRRGSIQHFRALRRRVTRPRG